LSSLSINHRDWACCPVLTLSFASPALHSGPHPTALIVHCPPRCAVSTSGVVGAFAIWKGASATLGVSLQLVSLARAILTRQEEWTREAKNTAPSSNLKNPSSTTSQTNQHRCIKRIHPSPDPPPHAPFFHSSICTSGSAILHLLLRGYLAAIVGISAEHSTFHPSLTTSRAPTKGPAAHIHVDLTPTPLHSLSLYISQRLPLLSFIVSFNLSPYCPHPSCCRC
jgi:hypothetical protein